MGRDPLFIFIIQPVIMAARWRAISDTGGLFEDTGGLFERG
jgi:hypothetical protein